MATGDDPEPWSASSPPRSPHLQTEAARAARFTLLVVLEGYRVPNVETALRPPLARWSETGIESRSASRRRANAAGR